MGAGYKLKFNFISKAYAEEIEYKKHAIDAILDTGAINTTIDIKSLSELIGVSAQVIYERVTSHITKWPSRSLCTYCEMC